MEKEVESLYRNDEKEFIVRGRGDDSDDSDLKTWITLGIIVFNCSQIDQYCVWTWGRPTEMIHHNLYISV